MKRGRIKSDVVGKFWIVMERLAVRCEVTNCFGNFTEERTV